MSVARIKDMIEHNNMIELNHHRFIKEKSCLTNVLESFENISGWGWGGSDGCDVFSEGFKKQTHR